MNSEMVVYGVIGVITPILAYFLAKHRIKHVARGGEKQEIRQRLPKYQLEFEF